MNSSIKSKNLKLQNRKVYYKTLKPPKVKDNYKPDELELATRSRMAQLRSKRTHVAYPLNVSTTVTMKELRTGINLNEAQRKEESMNELKKYINETPHLKNKNIKVKKMSMYVPKEYATNRNVHKLFGKPIGRKTKPPQFIFGYPEKLYFHMLPLNQARKKKTNFQAGLNMNTKKVHLLKKNSNFSQIPLNLQKKIFKLLN